MEPETSSPYLSVAVVSLAPALAFAVVASGADCTFTTVVCGVAASALLTVAAALDEGL